MACGRSIRPKLTLEKSQSRLKEESSAQYPFQK